MAVSNTVGVMAGAAMAALCLPFAFVSAQQPLTPAASRLAPAAAITPSPPPVQRAFLDTYCVTCHNQRLKTAGLALDAVDVARPAAGAEAWEHLAAAGRISLAAVGDPDLLPDVTTYRVRPDASQRGRMDGLPLGTQGGMAVRHVFPMDAEYEFRIRLWRTNFDNIRGLEEERDVEITIDRERVFLGRFGQAVAGTDAIVRFLVERGARIEATNDQGLTPIDIADGVGGRAPSGSDRPEANPSTAALLRQLLAAK